NRDTRVLVLVQASLGSGKSEPGTWTLGVLLDQLLPQHQLTRQVVVEPFSGHLDLEPLGVGRARGVLLGEREVALELCERVRRVRDVQVPERERRICGDRLLEMRIRSDE